MKDITIICLGGSSQGAFGAGALEALQPLKPRIKAIYGASSGALNAAAFYTGTLSQARTMYANYHAFAHPWRFLWSNALDVDAAMEHLQRFIREQDLRGSPCFVLVGERRTCAIRYEKLTMHSLRAAVSVPPYYQKSVRIDGKDYIDGAVIDIMAAHLIARTKHTIVIMNEPVMRDWHQRAKDVFEACIFIWTNPRLAWHIARKLDRYREQILELKDQGAIFIAPEKFAKLRDASPNTQERRWQDGLRAGKRVRMLL
jgi:predicted patatin/cPLA2 family phospholipase